MIDTESIDRLAERVTRLVPANLGQAGEDIRNNMRDVLARALRGLDLVTREEFDVQSELLARTSQRLDALEWRLAALEDKPPQ